MSATTQPPGLVTRMLGDVPPKRIEWFWHPYIPRGEVTEIDGDPGIGKSTIWVDLVARRLLNRTPPHGEFGYGGARRASTTARAGFELYPEARVLIFSAEDDASKILRPKFDAAGVPTRVLKTCVKVVDGVPDADGRLGAFQLENAEHVAFLRREVAVFRPTLLIMDPLSSHIGGQTDTHREAAVRSIVDQLTALAKRYDVTVIVVRHLRKSGGGPVIHKAQGNIAFSAAVRSALFAARDPTSPAEAPTYALAHAKANYGPRGPTLAYRVEARKHPTLGTKIGVVKWLGITAVDAERLGAIPDATATESSLDEAVAFLRTFLAEGPRAQADVLKAAKGEGISEKTLRRAKKNLGIGAQQRRDAHGRAAKWSWQLPAA